VIIYKGLKVRMGLLTGEPICSEDPITGRTDYFGPVVNRAARVQGTANGGQIIMSGSTWAEVQPHLAELVRLTSSPFPAH
jgi:adenylate cyclase